MSECVCVVWKVGTFIRGESHNVVFSFNILMHCLCVCTQSGIFFLSLSVLFCFLLLPYALPPLFTYVLSPDPSEELCI